MNKAVIETCSGEWFDYLNPEPSTIHITDVACGLGNICRFSGQIPDFYSVAEHSILMSEVMDDPTDAMWALMHDAAEAYICDIPSPLKQELGPKLEAIERTILKAVAQKFDLPVYSPKVYPLKVKDLDLRMFKLERNFVQNSKNTILKDVEPADVTPKCYGPDEAKSEFLSQYEHLCHQMSQTPDKTKKSGKRQNKRQKSSTTT